jgi:quercetin dioxygenase-like cupin family protein
MQVISDMFKEKQGNFEVDLGEVHSFSDGLYAKQVTIPKGYVAGQHAHTYSHLSILAKGKVIVRTDNTKKVYEAPACMEIIAGVHHAVEALEDCVWYCVHATNETDVDNIDKVLVTGKD